MSSFFPVIRVPEHEFIFGLFSLLLASLGALVSGYQWRRGRISLTWPLAFSLLGFSLLLTTTYFGGPFFLRKALPTWPIHVGAHLLESLAFALIALGAFEGRLAGVKRARAIGGTLALVLAVCLFSLWGTLDPRAPDLLQWFSLHHVLNGGLGALAVWGLLKSHRWLMGSGVALLFATAVLHGMDGRFADQGGLLLWNGEAFSRLGGLFFLTSAVGERGEDLLARFFVRLNLTFILLGALLILVLTQSSRQQFLELAEREGLELAEFLRSQVAYFHNRDLTLQAIVAEDPLIRRIVTSFGELPYLKEIRILCHRQWARYAIDPQGEIHEAIGDLPTPADWAPVPSPHLPSLALDRFSILTLPLILPQGQEGRVELVGTPAYFHRYIRHHLILIFGLTTGVVFLSTLLVGLLVHQAGQTIQTQVGRLRETEAELYQAAKLASLGELAGGVAHEVSNPTGVILTRAGLLLAEGEVLPAQAREDLKTIVHQAERIGTLTRELLSFARRSPLHPEPVRLNELVEETLRLVSPRLSHGRVEVRSDLDPNLPEIQADQDRLEQVLLNLFNNAIDAMPEGGRLSVTTRSTPGTARRGDAEGAVVIVEDSGAGIPHDILPRIFDPFFTTKGPGKGTGLGLSVSYGIIRDHGGTIQVESRVGQGTTFTISLPLEQKESRG